MFLFYFCFVYLVYIFKAINCYFVLFIIILIWFAYNMLLVRRSELDWPLVKSPLHYFDMWPMCKSISCLKTTFVYSTVLLIPTRIINDTVHLYNVLHCSHCTLCTQVDFTARRQEMLSVVLVLKTLHFNWLLLILSWIDIAKLRKWLRPYKDLRLSQLHFTYD